jgi:hypothetical protein
MLVEKEEPKAEMFIVNSVFGHRSVLEVAKYNSISVLANASMKLSIRFHLPLSSWREKVQVNTKVIRNTRCLDSQFCQ